MVSSSLLIYSVLNIILMRMLVFVYVYNLPFTPHRTIFQIFIRRRMVGNRGGEYPWEAEDHLEVTARSSQVWPERKPASPGLKPTAIALEVYGVILIC